MKGVSRFLFWIKRQDDTRTYVEKARDLLLIGEPFTANQANKILGWKFSTYIGLAEKKLKRFGFKVDRRPWEGHGKRRIYQLVKITRES
jgi:hypothetical protein